MENPMIRALTTAALLAFALPAAGQSTPAANYTDMWWNPSESGWGLSFAQHSSSQVFAVWYTYDTDREPLFLVVTTTRQADGSFTGPVFRQRNGTPFLQIDDQPPSPASDAVGSATFRFTDGDSGTFGYVIGQTSQSKPIVRLQVGSRAAQCQSETPAG